MPAGSNVAILNQALAMLGDKPLIDPGDDSARARVLSSLYAETVELVLTLHPWNCAMKRASLAALADAPAFGFTTAFQLPADCLRVTEVEPRGDFKVEQRTLLYDGTTVSIRYVASIANTALMQPTLRAVIATKLAADACIPLKGDRELAGQLRAQFQNALDEARYHDSLENAGDELQPSAYITAHQGGHVPLIGTT